MELYRSLYEMSRLLLAQPDGERTAEILLTRLVESVGAERGFRDGRAVPAHEP
jgi:hypothetical protein